MSAFVTQHVAALKSAARRLTGSPLNTLLALFVIGIALALPSTGWVILTNLRELAGNASGVQQISLFMTIDADKKDVEDIEARLKAQNIGQWRFVSRDDALANLQASEGMADIVASLPKNPLPHAFIVEPDHRTSDALEALAAEYVGWPKVAHVQLDSAWVERLHALLALGRSAVLMLAGLLGFALVVVTFNTIRLQILAHANEIEVARLIGATDAFVRRPYLYFGTLQGALGGLFAAALVAVGLHLLSPPVAELVTLYGGNFTLRGLSPLGVGLLTAGGALLGWLGALLSLAIHLRHSG